jgi:hypothetical protein
MSAKKLLIIIGIVAVLIALAVFKKIVQSIETAKQLAREAASDYVLIKDSPESLVNKITVYRGDEEANKLILSKDPEGEWVIESRLKTKARAPVINNFLKDLNGLKGEVRSDTKDVLGDFQIQDNQAVHLILESGKRGVLYHLEISLLRPVWNKNFIRREGSNKVVLVKKDFLSQFNFYGKDSKVDDIFITDLKVFSFEQNDIQKFKISINGKEPISLSKAGQENAWSIEPALSEEEELDVSKIEEFLRNISGMIAKEPLDPGINTYGFDKPKLEITLFDSKANKAHTLIVGNYIEADKLHYAKILPSGRVYTLYDNSIQSLKNGRSYFIKLKPKAPRENGSPNPQTGSGISKPPKKK